MGFKNLTEVLTLGKMIRLDKRRQKIQTLIVQISCSQMGWEAGEGWFTHQETLAMPGDIFDCQATVEGARR